MLNRAISRRDFFLDALKLGMALRLPDVWAQSEFQKSDRLIVHSAQPEDLETPLELLASWITPNDLFFVRSHFYTPRVEAARWRLEVDGEVERPLSLSLEQLKGFEPVSATFTLECAGNGRSFYRPRVAGVQWRHGAVGTALWRGVRLRDILKKAGVKTQGRHILLEGADSPMTAKMPDFARSIPLEKALDENTLLAYEMNGQPLLASHGYPLRAVVPGWAGDNWIKWLTHIRVLKREHDGHFMKNAYRVPRLSVEPGADVDPAEMEVITALEVKSIIVSPADGARLHAGAIEITGTAWTGKGEIARVEVSTDSGRTWHTARLGRERALFAWRLWKYTWTAEGPGSYLVMARATDSTGRIQPLVPAWNPSGYLWNAVHRIRVNVGKV